VHGVITDASPHIYDIGGDSHAVPCFVAPTIELSELYLVNRPAAQVMHKDSHKAIIDCRLRPRCANHDEYLLVFVVEKNLVGISSAMLVMFCRRLGIHTTRYRAISVPEYVFYVFQNPKT